MTDGFQYFTPTSIFEDLVTVPLIGDDNTCYAWYVKADGSAIQYGYNIISENHVLHLIEENVPTTQELVAAVMAALPNGDDVLY